MWVIIKKVNDYMTVTNMIYQVMDTTFSNTRRSQHFFHETEMNYYINLFTRTYIY